MDRCRTTDDAACTGVGLLIVVPSLALAACAPAANGPVAERRSAGPAPSAGPGGEGDVVGRRARSRMPSTPSWRSAGRALPDLEVIEASSGHSFLRLPDGVPDAAWGHVVTTSTGWRLDGRPDAGRRGGRGARELRIDGDWRLPTVGARPRAGRPLGRRLDHRPRLSRATDPYATSTAPSRFAVVHAPSRPRRARWSSARIVELPGGFDFDALSPDGSILYVVEHLDDAPAAPTRSAPSTSRPGDGRRARR